MTAQEIGYHLHAVISRVSGPEAIRAMAAALLSIADSIEGDTIIGLPSSGVVVEPDITAIVPNGVRISE